MKERKGKGKLTLVAGVVKLRNIYLERYQGLKIDIIMVYIVKFLSGVCVDIVYPGPHVTLPELKSLQDNDEYVCIGSDISTDDNIPVCVVYHTNRFSKVMLKCVVCGKQTVSLRWDVDQVLP